MFKSLLSEIDKAKKAPQNNSQRLEEQYREFLDDFEEYNISLKRGGKDQETEQKEFGRPYKV